MKRWHNLLKIYKKDYSSFRVLFTIEVLVFLDKWSEPQVEELNKMLTHAMDGGRIGIRIGRITDLFLPVWPLEVAKFDVMLLRTFSNHYLPKNYFFTYIKLIATALVQTWWAFETLMNDFASIIVKQRKSTLDHVDKLFLQDRNVALNKKGKIEERITYQQIDTRIQYIYKILTNESIDRAGRDWQNLMNLKNARDTYIHRIGKGSKRRGPSLMDKTVILKGFKSVQNIIGEIFQKTPEFSNKFTYKFLTFWSCKNQLPFFWDGSDGNAFYVGLTEVEPKAIIEFFAPKPSMFSLFDEVAHDDQET